MVPDWSQIVLSASSSAELDLERLADHEALAVVVADRRKDQPELGLAPHRPGGIARQHVDLL